MINIILYLDNLHNPIELVEELLRHQLIASATIDERSISYKLTNEIIEAHYNHVITMQTKALLFNDIVNFSEKHMGCKTPIYSVPVVCFNKGFEEIIKTTTKKI